MQTPGEVIGDAPPTVLEVFPSMRSPPEAVRASLEAVRAAQLAARARARREMWQARAVVGGVAAAVALAGLVVWPRIHAARAARAASAVTAAAASARPTASQNAPAAATAPAPGGLLAAGVADLPAMKEASAAAASAGAAALDACRDSYQGKRWRAASSACASAFAAHPDDAKLALRVAEAEYARDHLPEAREWAQRTLALDAKQADALAILGRSEQRTGHGEAAARAFRRYLAVAPRGWHAGEARAALRGEHARPATPAARASQARERDESTARPTNPVEQAATAPSAFAPPVPATEPAP